MTNPFRLLSLLALVAAVGCECGAEPVVERTVVLRLVPVDVAFGEVPLGALRERSVIVQNDGNAPWIPAGPPTVTGSGFAVVSGCDVAVDPGGTCTAALSFQPEAEGAAAGVFAVEQPDAAGVVVVDAALTGFGTPATLLWSPEVFEFGTVNVGESTLGTVTLENRGADPLDVPLLLSGGAFFVDGATRVVQHVEPNAGVDVVVSFAPPQGVAFAGLLTAEICGTACGPAVVLSGTGSAPRVDVQPRRLEIGAVAAGETGSGTLRVSNIGQGALAIEGVDVEDGSGSFLLTVPVLPVVLGAGEGFDVVVAFSPVEGRGVDDVAVVVVRSTDPVSGSVLVPVVASAPGAGLEVIPRVGQFGFLDEGSERQLSVVVRSTGDAAVDVRSIRLEGDPGFSIVGAPVPGPLAPGDAAQFFVVARANAASASAGGAESTLVVRSDAGDERVPLAFTSGDSGCIPRALVASTNLGAVQVGLSKGGDVVVENVGDAVCELVRIASGSELGLPDDNDFDALPRGLFELEPGTPGFVSFDFLPRRTGSRSAVVGLFFEGRAVPLLVSVSGTGVRGGLVGAPGSVSLGPLPADCASPEANVVFFNDGASFVEVESLALEPADVPFTVLGPIVPFILQPGQSIGMVVAGIPGDAVIGDNLAGLVASSVEGLSARIDLRLILSGPSEPVTENFRVPDEIAIDVLLVIDNSGSMQDDQQLLADNFEEFIAAALDDADLDVQLGVTTTDVLSEGAAAGTLIGSPSILSARDGDDLAERVLVGIDGTGLELGLEAMRLALEVPENAGFIRADAALAIIFVTDEEDAGAFPEFLPDPALSRAPAEYIALLEARKAGSVLNAPVLVSAVLPPNGGNRYRDVVEHFSGVSLDITDPTWGTRLSEIGNETFALARSFSIGSPPRNGSVSVSIDGVAVTAFTIDLQRQAIVLDEPAPGGADVDITYIPECR
ncbi:MAG: choice-of-anchor D domain-containing protein [Deltaproteobacteria bacterium]|nr:choice-of-anchor D domain-containing protein [Deltaproteobacteria bacterium]